MTNNNFIAVSNICQPITLRNTFYCLDIHRSVNTIGHMQNKCHWKGGHHVDFVRDPLRSYFDEYHKTEIHLLYLHFIVTAFLLIICEVLLKIL